MELNLFTSVLSGTLKPWANGIDNNKFYSNNTTLELVKPTNYDLFYTELKRTLGSDHEIFQKDSFEIYLVQKNKKDPSKISFPLLGFHFAIAQSPSERFYFAIIQNESNRLFQRLYDTLSKDIKQYDRATIVNTFHSNLKHVLSLSGSVLEHISSGPSDHINIINHLQSNIIALIIQTQLLYSDYLKTIPLDKFQIYGEILKIDYPKDFDNWVKPTNSLSSLTAQLKEIESDLPLKKYIPDNALSFKYLGDKPKLKTFLVKLNKSIELLSPQSSTDELYEIFISKDLSEINTPIYLGCDTIEFRYILDAIKNKFANLSPTSVGNSGLFRSQDHPDKIMGRDTLYSSKPKFDTKNKSIIDEIVKEL
jgi:hypothetical protein